ncbi:MAG: 1-acyl-sn-glycerol-3-phosphate acyltransferase, partial [Acidobacteriota bacterium]|nr:1-acyl-sn-glycerol-3-phosphate acyltransferase [Acidobacteriota bacterium]
RLHRVFPAAAQDYFFSSVPRVAFSSVVVNALPFDRHVDPEHSLEVCRHLLANPGNVLVIFPEGTRTTSGEMARFKLGVGFLVAGRPFPVLPCHLDGAFAAWPKGASVPRPKKIRLRIGDAVSFADLAPGKESAVEVSRVLHDAVSALAPTHSGERTR